MSSIRNIDELSLDDITEEFLRDECIDMGDELGVDTRQGSIYRDAAEGHIIRTAKFFSDLRQVAEIISLNTCTGDVLDEKLRERGLSRNPAEATPAKYLVDFVGTPPEIDAELLCEEYVFNLQMEDEKYILVSQTLGSEANNLVPGTVVIPDIDVNGLISARLGKLVVPAIDVEDDDSARERLINRISGPDENGNKSQVKTWCESVEGVGRARIIPLWNGPNTVQGVIIGKDGGVPADIVVANVQKYIDPGAEGMGEGVANIGQFFTAVAAEPVVVNITVSVLKSSDASYSEIQEDFKKLMQDYIQRIALTDFSNGISIRVAHAGALLDGMESVIDYDNLTLNGSGSNVPFSIYQIPVLGEVKVDGNIS
ncbi:MAG: baseplate J/gp47 family protein [Eubacteriales bacterium]|nr:baseplate J/gp47 family protein [Eubacteriales bacterium]